MVQLQKTSALPPAKLDKTAIEKETKKMAEKIGELAEIMFAQQKHSLLIVFQGMDGSGKDGACKNAFKSTQHAFVDYISYKKPTEEEFAHDFLWRVHKNTPHKGKIQISVRSHYEDILIQRVHQWIDDKKVARRMKSINDFESLLHSDNNTTIIKFFLHLSPTKQLEKLIERIEDPTKNWKHKDGDWQERKLWKEYQSAYQYAIQNSTIPWIIVPSDKRWYRNHVVTKHIYETLKSMKLEYHSLKGNVAAQNLLAEGKAELAKLTKQVINKTDKPISKKHTVKKDIQTKSIKPKSKS